MQIITVDEKHCIGCNACVRVCPVHANVTRLKENTTDEFVTTIDSEACINCGECVKVCRHGARGYNDHFKIFKEMFEAGKEMILIVAPAIRTSYPYGTWKVLLSWLRENGNCRIYDVGYGADICSYMYNQYLLKHPGKKLITQPCPTVVNYIQKYKPELIPYLSPVLSPVGCLATWLRKYQHETAPLFMLSPCIAKASEAGREGLYDYNVTFRNLDKYVNKRKIDWDILMDFKFDAAEGSIGRIYPMPSGLKETMLMLNPNLVIRNTEGIHELYPALDRYGQTEDSRKPDVLDVLNCRHGCNRGTALPEEDTSLLEVEQIMNEISSTSIRETSGGIFGIGRMKRFKEFDKTLHLEDFLTTYKDESAHRPKLTPEQYDAVFEHMHKHDFTSQNINCGACGYKHCRDMAYAIHYKMNVRENCIYYLKYSLKKEYNKLKEMYNACLTEIERISQVSQQMKESQDDILADSAEMKEKASVLSQQIMGLQAISTECRQYAETLSKDDLLKLQEFISSINTMSQDYSEMAMDFGDQSEGIYEQIQVMTDSVTSLSALSVNLEQAMKTPET